MKNTKVIAWGIRLVSRQIGQLKLLMACLMIGVFALTATIASVDTFTKGLQTNGAELLGGDIGVVSRNTAYPIEVIDAFNTTASKTTKIVRLRSMVKSATTLSLAEVKGIDDNYPLLGKPTSSSGSIVPNIGEIVIAPELAKTLNVSTGDRVQLGKIELIVSGIYETEPEIDVAGINLAPRAIVHISDIERAQLLVQGSQVYYALRGLVSDDVNVSQWLNDFKTQFKEKRYNLSTREKPSNNINRIVMMAQDFFMVLSLAVVVISGIGIQMAMRVYLNRNIATLAILKSLGLGQGQVLLFMVSMVATLSVFVSVVGAGLGSVVPMYVIPLVKDALPFDMPFYYPSGALLTGIVFGILATFTFSALPILRALNVKGADLFRSIIIPSGRVSKIGKIGVAILLFMSIAFVLLLSSSPERMAIFVIAILMGALVLYLLARGCVYGLSKLSGVKNTSLRLSISNLTAKGNGTVHVVVSLGMGLTLFTAVSTVYQSVNIYFKESMEVPVPDMVILDIDRNQVDATKQILLDSAKRPDSVSVNKIINVKVLGINGVKSEDIKPAGDEWFIRGDRRATWLHEMPKQNKNVIW